MLRYQKEQQPNMLKRWAAHVDPWRTFAEVAGQNNILALRYEDLDRNFVDTLKRISIFLEKPLDKITRPNQQSIKVGNAFPKHKIVPYNLEDRLFFETQIGTSMHDAGYKGFITVGRSLTAPIAD